nr:probable protein phosphatase 2C 33 [Solanum lycopersicum]
MDKAHPLSTSLMVRSLQVSKDSFRPQEENEESLDPEVPYLRAIDALMYVANSTRPDIEFSVNLLARFSSSPTLRHCNGLKHILRYLKGTSDMGLFYTNKDSTDFIGYVDAGYLSDPHKARSQTGYPFTNGGTSVVYQKTGVTDSNTENRGVGCVGALDCLLNIVRALRTGSCLTYESRTPVPGSPTSAVGVKKKKSRRVSRNSSFNKCKEEQLRKTPGRLFLNGSSEAASLFTQQGKKGTNQDAMVVWENFASRTDTVFCGVFDGHGPHGHMVAKRVRDSLPSKLSAHWEVSLKSEDVLKEISLNAGASLYPEDASLISAADDSRVSIDVEETGKHPEIFQTLKESFLKAYKVMDRELKSYTNIDCFCSGTTAVTLIKQGQDLVIGNVGDSRAILGTRDKDGSLTAVQLTVDLKPNLPAEAERIRKCRGRVFSLHDEPEVARVWLPNSDSPGLAMARAFGDFCLKDFGLISVPEISYRRLTGKDEFIVLATDGIWDVLTNDEVVKIVASASSRSSAARSLVESAVRAWRTKYPTSKVDDCAVVCLFLDSNSNNLSTASNTEDSDKTVSMKANEVGAKTGDASGPTAFTRSGTVREVEVSEEEIEEASEHEELLSEVGAEWSALEGVSRLNTLLTLPRFVPDKDEN